MWMQFMNQTQYHQLVALVLLVNVLFTLIWLYRGSSFDGPKFGAGLTRHNYEERLSPMDLLNASAVFNEVNNALRQKNADLNPIGVSYFPAFVPEGTLLYHSNWDGEIPAGFEWVAMDYEFSYNFAHFNRPKGGGPGWHKPPGGRPGGSPKHGPKGPRPPGPPGQHNLTNVKGGLLTFRVTKPLDKLIYLGGASAAKTQTGEMDTQYLLTELQDPLEFDERSGAEAICAWGKQNGGLDGIVRLEIGFEIIICDFQSGKLDLINKVTLTSPTEVLNFPEEKRKKEDDSEEARDGIEAREVDLDTERSAIIDVYEAMSGYEHYQAGARHYDSEPRILLDFRSFVTMLNRTFIDPDPYVRRISNISEEQRLQLKADVSQMLHTSNNPYVGTNWQAVTSAIEQKFGPMLMLLNQSLSLYDYAQRSEGSDSYTIDTLGRNLTTYTYNFVRRYRDKTYRFDKEFQIKDAQNMAVWDWAHPVQDLSSEADFLIWNSIIHVQKAITSAVFECFELGVKILDHYYVDNSLELPSQEEISKSLALVSNLLDYLRWSIFYQCSKTCDWNEICFVPTWGPAPLGWNDGPSIGKKLVDGKVRIVKDCQCISYETILNRE